MGGECKSVQKACKRGAGAKKNSDVVKFLKESAGLATMQNDICHKSCNKKDLPTIDGWADEPFEEDKEAAIKSALDSLKGMPGMENLKMMSGGDALKAAEDHAI